MQKKLQLNSSLLDSVREPIDIPAEFEACLNERGLYNTDQFVLRLSPRVHNLISNVPTGVYTVSELDEETIQAYATYLHETVHWWQHIGSNIGLVLSLAYPAQSHSNFLHLKSFIEKVGPVKSIRKWVAEAQRSKNGPEDAIREANIIVNNVFDLDFFKAFVVKPSRARELSNHQYFESVGHTYHMAYGHCLGLLASTVDRDFDFLPDARGWDDEFLLLKEKKVTGFYWRSPIELPPLGLHALFEGQARFIQLQYLAFGKFLHFSFQDFRDAGLLDGIYVEAFEMFLNFTGTDEPEEIDDPLVAIFLLICDLSINPTVGFPQPIKHFEIFLYDTDPGTRFVRFCQALKDKCPELLSAITDYSKEEYLSVSEALCHACHIENPHSALDQVRKWTEQCPGVSQVMDEYETFNYDLTNLPVRVLFSHYVAYSKDKFEHPEFFCWSGAWMSGSRVSETSQSLFLRHLSLFTDKEDSDAVFPRLMPDKDYEGLMEMFNTFFVNNMLYDITRQWVIHDGPFQYDFEWLSQEYKTTEVEESVMNNLAKIYGFKPDDMEII